jgi:hypothetical protein
MPDNKAIDVTGDQKGDMLECAVAMAMVDDWQKGKARTAVGYRNIPAIQPRASRTEPAMEQMFEPPRLIIYWSKPTVDVAEFIAPKGPVEVASEVRAWFAALASGGTRREIYGPEPDMDGDLGEGFHLWLPGFKDFTALFTVEPVYAWYHK